LIQVKIELADLPNLWRIVHIFITKDGERYLVKSGHKSFSSQAHAEQDARLRAMRFLQRNFGIENGNIIWDVLPPSPSERREPST